MIPTTLSERTFDQLVGFFDRNKLSKKKLRAFFSMVQMRKTLHQDTMQTMRKAHPKRFLRATIPFAADIEKMGQNRAPVTVFAGRSAASTAYQTLYDELESKVVGPE